MSSSAVRWNDVTGVAQRTISSAAVAGRSRLKSSHWSGNVGERHHALGDRVAGGLVARHRQQDHEEAELVVGELVALDVGLHQLGDEVLAGFFARARPPSACRT